MDNYRDTIISQYANSPIIGALSADFNTWVDPSADFDQFYNLVMDLDTAGSYGLGVWGRIVGVTNVIQIPIRPLFFGFAEAGPYHVGGFAESTHPGAFYDGSSAVTSPYTLPDASYRLLIFAKALYNITDGSIPAINKILLTLFAGRGDCWVSDDGNMTLTYRFSFVLTDIEYAIVTQSGVLPKPVGVSFNVVTS